MILHNSSLRHSSSISTMCTQSLYWRYRTLVMLLYFTFSIAADPSSERVIYLLILILFKILNTKLQTHFLSRYVSYRKKPNTALESKAAFVHLKCILHSAAQFAWTKALPSSLVVWITVRHKMIYHRMIIRLFSSVLFYLDLNYVCVLDNSFQLLSYSIS
jgi:hypothetical protein